MAENIYKNGFPGNEPAKTYPGLEKMSRVYQAAFVMADQALTRKLKAGEEVNFDMLFARYYRKVSRLFEKTREV